MKIVALTGMLGYGYSEESLEHAFSEKVDYVGVDAGSTDPGPYYLGSGKSFTDRNAVKRDLALALPKVLEHKAPFIIGSAGGAGSKRHVEWLKEILLEICKEKKLSFIITVQLLPCMLIIIFPFLKRVSLRFLNLVCFPIFILDI